MPLAVAKSTLTALPAGVERVTTNAIVACPESPSTTLASATDTVGGAGGGSGGGDVFVLLPPLRPQLAKTMTAQASTMARTHFRVEIFIAGAV